MRTLDDMAREYESRCEAYDRRVCTGMVGPHGIMPANEREQALVSANARRVFEDIIRGSHFSPSELRSAIRGVVVAGGKVRLGITDL